MSSKASLSTVVFLAVAASSQLWVRPVFATTQLPTESKTSVTMPSNDEMRGPKFGNGLLKEKLLQLKETILSRKQERMEDQVDRKEMKEASPGARKTEKLENVEERMESLADRVENRFAKHEERLTAWITRAEKHTAERKAKGKDTINAEKAIAGAKTSLANAVALGKAAVVEVRKVAPEDWKTANTEVKAAKEAVNKAQVAFAQVIKDMKQILVELKKLNE